MIHDTCGCLYDAHEGDVTCVQCCESHKAPKAVKAKREPEPEPEAEDAPTD